MYFVAVVLNQQTLFCLFFFFSFFAFKLSEKINGSIDPKSSLFIPLVTLQWQNQYPPEISDPPVASSKY